VAFLALVTREIGAKLVQISSDYVFDGTKGAPYLEDDLPRPLSVYGESKLAGELNVDVNPDIWCCVPSGSTDCTARILWNHAASWA